VGDDTVDPWGSGVSRFLPNPPSMPMVIVTKLATDLSVVARHELRLARPSA
jgi:hypothetical protein